MKMSFKATTILGSAALLALTGCIDPADYETAPVTVETAKGPVVCQLYRKRQVIWDEAISIPPGMSIKEGDQICINEGKRRLRG